MGWVTFEAVGTIEGMTVQVTFINNCTFSGDYNCDFNYINHQQTRRTTTGYIEQGVNNGGDRVVTIQYYY